MACIRIMEGEMQGNIVTAAKWLGASLVLASVILVGGLYWVLSSQVGRLDGSIHAVVTAPPEGVEKLSVKSEELRQAGDEWERLWLLDQPSHLTPFKTHGGVGP
jgi:hypothetical protein